MTESVCVIVGAGHAAAQAAPALRQQGWEGRILIIGEEPYLPYNRPPLSKTFLSGEHSHDDLLIRHAEAYEKGAIEFSGSTRVEAIEREGRRLQLSDGRQLDYDKLILATGGDVRRLEVPGADLPGLYYLRTIADVEAIRPELRPGRRVVIIGGGYIGLESAAMLVGLGLDVTVLERNTRVLSKVAAAPTSRFFSRLHAEEGVTISTCAQVSALGGEEEGRVKNVQCVDGRVFPADLVIAGIGIVPRDELAATAGLAVNDGVLVDAQCRSSDPDIMAVGDCARFESERYGGRLRLESVQNAVDQARVAAATVCGAGNTYNALPWFWSDQYDVKYQIAGLAMLSRAEHDESELVLRGDAEQGRKFALFYLREGRVVAVDAINSPQEFMFGKRLIDSAVTIDPVRLGDPSTPMKSLLG